MAKKQQKIFLANMSTFTTPLSYKLANFVLSITVDLS